MMNLRVRTLAVLGFVALFLPSTAHADLYPRRVLVQVAPVEEPAPIVRIGGLTYDEYYKKHGGGKLAFGRWLKSGRRRIGKDVTGTFAQQQTTPSEHPLLIGVLGEAVIAFGDGNRQSVMGGGQVMKVLNANLALYGQLVGGYVHTIDGNGFSVQPGGGALLGGFLPFVLDVTIAQSRDHFSIGGTSGWQFSAGIVLH